MAIAKYKYPILLAPHFFVFDTLYDISLSLLHYNKEKKKANQKNSLHFLS